MIEWQFHEETAIALRRLAKHLAIYHLYRDVASRDATFAASGRG